MFSAAHLRARRRFPCGIAVCALLCAAAVCAAQSKDVPDATIPLQPLGYQPAPAHILLAEGYTVSSLQYVDAHHLLFTYNARTLIKRMPEDSPDDSPQNVDALLLEVPSGKVVARAQWRLHDHAQYLWPVGDGTFLLRLGRELRLLTPLAESDPADMLQGKLLMTLPGQASRIEVSPDGRMMLVEADVATHPADTTPAMLAPPPQSAAAAAMSTSSLGVKPVPVVEDHTTDIQFLEFDLSGQASGHISVKRVGHIIAPGTLSVPLVHEGYIHAQENYTDDWLLIYTHLDGTAITLGDVVSTCQPSAAFLSNREVLVDTCNGADTALMMIVITLDKKELWQHALDSAGMEPSVRVTPASGRFAVSRILTDSAATAGIGMVVDDSVRMQRIDVMDIKNGALVARVTAAPAERVAQNFALSADGRHLAVMQNDVIALYDLAAPQDFPAAKIKPKDVVFVAAPDGAPVPAAPAAPD